ncbi:hypothetical protein [Geomonas azotofigens]|uniref:hypothetical protein n=1 Tax=Geomonas azotofigens TaxID=2843196 RepID=UPI001C10A086|nr:hypothetical protein [Geomonas azotofigens]MBU5612172.1 hypothetical protein [Geomonas azotofigens]
MGKTSVRLSPEICKKLENEARRRSEVEGETVTVSELIRACIGEKFPQICARARSERAGFSELQEVVAGLGKRAESLEAHIDSLVKTLGEILPLLATREQVDALTDAIAAVLSASRERRP